jgi:hypothetical protein
VIPRIPWILPVSKGKFAESSSQRRLRALPASLECRELQLLLPRNAGQLLPRNCLISGTLFQTWGLRTFTGYPEFFTIIAAELWFHYRSRAQISCKLKVCKSASDAVSDWIG